LSSIPRAQLLEPVSEAAPSGESLEYDPLFAEMERAAQGTPEQQYGETIIEGQEPNWEEVQRTSLELLERTRDLRPAVALARSALKNEGFPAFRDALAVLHGFVDKFWDTVHPQLDPDDDNDPTMRVNTLAGLCDVAGVLNLLRTVPLVSSRTVGRFTKRDIGIATGEIPYTGPEDAKPKMSLIDAAFQDCPLEQLQADTEAATEAVALARGIESTVTKLVGAGNMRSLDPFVKEIESIRKILAERLNRRGGGAPAAGPSAAAPEASAPAAAASPAQAAAPAAVTPWNGEITSRANAIRAIEKVCRYFETYEPSSPLPLLLHRAVRLSTKSFLEILRDISPDGLTQAETLGGMSSDEYSAHIAAAAEKDERAAPPPPPPPPPSAAPAPPSPDDY
jgi:type VI secretion system protein ImpA